MVYLSATTPDDLRVLQLWSTELLVAFGCASSVVYACVRTVHHAREALRERHEHDMPPEDCGR